MYYIFHALHCMAILIPMHCVHDHSRFPCISYMAIHIQPFQGYNGSQPHGENNIYVLHFPCIALYGYPDSHAFHTWLFTFNPFRVIITIFFKIRYYHKFSFIFENLNINTIA
jgi:hypothetical protein